MKFCLVLKDKSIVYTECNDLVLNINEKEQSFICDCFLNGKLHTLRVEKVFCDSFDLKARDLFI